MNRPTHKDIAVAAYYLWQLWVREEGHLEMSYPGTEYFWYLAEQELGDTSE